MTRINIMHCNTTQHNTTTHNHNTLTHDTIPLGNSQQPSLPVHINNPHRSASHKKMLLPDDSSQLSQRYTMDLAESGVRVEAVNDNRAGQVRFDLTHLRSDASSFYVIVMSFDTHYNKSSLLALSSTSLQLSNPVYEHTHN